MQLDEDRTTSWPPLPYDAWHETAATLHLWLQIVGKLGLMQSPWVNHSWHVALQVTARGLGTRLLQCGEVSFQVDFDFIDHLLLLRATNGGTDAIPLRPQTTATFYQSVMSALRRLGVTVAIHTMPNELANPIPFESDEIHCSYDAQYVTRYWRILAQVKRVFDDFRPRFIGG